MSFSARRNLELANAPIPPDKSDPTRAGQGLRFRESRLRIPDTVKCVLIWRDFYGKEHEAPVIDISRYGCRVILPRGFMSFKLFTKTIRSEIRIDGVVAYQGAFFFVNEKHEDNGDLSAGVAVEKPGCDLDVLTAASGIRSLSIEDDLRSLFEMSEVVQDKFKVLVADLNTLLHEIKQKLEAEETKIAADAQSNNHQFRLEERVISVAMSIYSTQLQKILSEFQEFTKTLKHDEETQHRQYFRLNFQGLTNGTPFVDRSMKRPLGYAGDYGMMVMLYEYYDQGSTLFNRFFHRFVCMEPAAVANRNRVGFLSDILLAAFEQALKNGQKTFSIVSVACGPAREIYEFLKYAPLTAEMPVQITLIDTEELALEYAQNKLREIAIPDKSVDLVFLKEDAVVGTLQGREFLKWFKEADFIISAGLFDYLTDRVSQRMISMLYSQLKAGGQLLIGNISTKSPDVFAMDYFMNWHLILRDEPDLLKLVHTDITTKQNGEADVTSEAMGLNLFLRVRRKS